MINCHDCDEINHKASLFSYSFTPTYQHCGILFTMLCYFSSMKKKELKIVIISEFSCSACLLGVLQTYLEVTQQGRCVHDGIFELKK